MKRSTMYFTVKHLILKLWYLVLLEFAVVNDALEVKLVTRWKEHC
jgi:hypothetical protein